MSNVQRLTQFIGKTGSVKITGQDGIKFHVKVSDVRMVYSAMQCFCEPICGSGGRWYAASSIEFHDIKSQEVK